jgi:hypothetical protein
LSETAPFRGKPKPSLLGQDSLHLIVDFDFKIRYRDFEKKDYGRKACLNV